MPSRCRRSLVVTAALFGLATTSLSGQTQVARTSDVTSLDSIIAAVYDAISGPVGQPRQWDRFTTLFHPEARLVPTRCPETGPCTLRVLTPSAYRQLADSFLVNEGFREVELSRRTERYGAIAHAFTSYASFRRGETTPFARGINSMQFFWDGSRWWVLSIYWDSERPNNPLPPAFETRTP